MVGQQAPHRSFMTYTSPHSGVMLCPCSYLWSTACASCSTCTVPPDLVRSETDDLSACQCLSSCPAS